jgi:hypothetical protein
VQELQQLVRMVPERTAIVKRSQDVDLELLTCAHNAGRRKEEEEPLVGPSVGKLAVGGGAFLEGKWRVP